MESSRTWCRGILSFASPYSHNGLLLLHLKLRVQIDFEVIKILYWNQAKHKFQILPANLPFLELLITMIYHKMHVKFLLVARFKNTSQRTVFFFFQYHVRIFYLVCLNLFQILVFCHVMRPPVTCYSIWLVAPLTSKLATFFLDHIQNSVEWLILYFLLKPLWIKCFHVRYQLLMSFWYHRFEVFWHL
jgi:hypothetical protein